MLKKLQRKFVLFTTIISIIVMMLIAVSINVANYVSIMNHSDNVLDLLVQGELKMGEPLSDRGKLPSEIAFTTRFFTVRSDITGIIDHIDTRNISSISADEAIEYVSRVNGTGTSTGTMDYFRYIKTENQIGYTYIFLNIEEDLISFESSMVDTILILLGAIVSIFILSILLSKKVVAPIADSYERQKGFITNVSHEFKTPLTIIKADCEVIEIDHGEGEWTNSIKTQISRLDTLVENLISLTKLDEKVALIKTDFSLSDAIVDTVNEFVSAIKGAQLHLTLDIEPGISYTGDEAYIRNLIGILTENSIKYGTAKTTLKLSLSTMGHKKVFSIQNACSPIAIGKHNDWFERFYREDLSRNMETRGYGIGLSIAKSICDLHSAKIFAESKTGEEITITVVF